MGEKRKGLTSKMFLSIEEGKEVECNYGCGGFVKKVKTYALPQYAEYSEKRNLSVYRCTENCWHFWFVLSEELPDFRNLSLSEFLDYRRE